MAFLKIVYLHAVHELFEFQNGHVIGHEKFHNKIPYHVYTPIDYIFSHFKNTFSNT